MMKRAISAKNLWEMAPRPVRAVVGRLLGLAPVRTFLGSAFRRERRHVLGAERWPAERAREYQLKALRHLCTLAHKASPYYRSVFESVGFCPEDLQSLDDLEALPTINRETVRTHCHEMITRRLDHPSVDQVSTGGTSGIPLFFYIGKERSAIEYAYLTASWERAGYRLGMPMAVLRGRIVRPDRRGFLHEYDPVLRHHHYSNFHMTDLNVRRYLSHIAGLGPCFLHVYPSSAAALARFMRRSATPAPRNILAILAESENVYPSQRAETEEAFGVRLFSSYGHSEKCVLAAECEHSTDYHVWPTYGYFELLDEQGRAVTTPGQRGEIVGTSFINTVMPFIRYRTGDYATYVGERCEKCGREHTLIRDVEGRWPSGALVAADDSYISMTALNVHDDTFQRVQQFQFYQDAPGEAVLRVVPAPGFSDEDYLRIQKNLGRKLDGRLTFTIKQVDSIPLSPRGKAIYVDQRIPGVSDRVPAQAGDR